MFWSSASEMNNRKTSGVECKIIGHTHRTYPLFMTYVPHYSTQGFELSKLQFSTGGSRAPWSFPGILRGKNSALLSKWLEIHIWHPRGIRIHGPMGLMSIKRHSNNIYNTVQQFFCPGFFLWFFDVFWQKNNISPSFDPFHLNLRKWRHFEFLRNRNFLMIFGRHFVQDQNLKNLKGGPCREFSHQFIAKNRSKIG